MKTSVKNIFFALGATAILASCGENAWNDHLDGFEGGPNYNTPLEGAFTMSAADYNAVASNATNKELAGDNLAKALKAVGSNGMFSAQIPAKEYLPAYLASSSAPYFKAPVGSKINITYDETGETEPIIAEIADAAKYTVSDDDYINAWGSDTDYIKAFAPETPASAKLPAILKAGIANPQEGQYAVVSYEEAAENPVFVELGDAPLVDIYSETFSESEGAFLAHNVKLSDGISYVWKLDSYGYMKASAYNKQAFESDAWFVSPSITLGGSKACVSFDHAINKFADLATAISQVSVAVKPEGGNWETLEGVTYPDGLSWTFVNSGEVDLSKYCGSTIQIGFHYTSSTASAGTWEVKNFLVKAQEGTVGANPGFAPMKKALVSNPVMASKTAVYTYDGKKWTAAADVVALDAADYTAMGFSNNKLEKPEVYIPLYLKANKPYAVEGDEIAVVYNGTACAFAIYDGQNWTVNNNDFQTRTAQFENTADGWVFKKYIGISYFNLATELTLDTQYLIVAEGICAVPLATSKNYGYLNPEAVVITEGVISQKTEVNAFTFASTVKVDDTTYKLPEGLFVIIDSNGRYLYMSGSFDSFNVADAPLIKDGALNAGYTWKAEKTGDDTWTISNGENSKWIQYSTSYSSFGCYGTEKGVLPALYVLSAE